MFHFDGSVVKGEGKGKTLSCPTANLDVKLPEDLENGVYIATAVLRGHEYQAVANVGVSPYFKDRPRILEVHLLHHFDDDFYGENMRGILKKFLRPERADFASVDELKQAIQTDIANARSF